MSDKPSEAVDNLVSQIQAVEPGSGACNDIDHDEACKLIQQFLDEQLAERDKRIEKLTIAIDHCLNRYEFPNYIRHELKEAIKPEAPHV